MAYSQSRAKNAIEFGYSSVNPPSTDKVSSNKPVTIPGHHPDSKAVKKVPKNLLGGVTKRKKTVKGKGKKKSTARKSTPDKAGKAKAKPFHYGAKPS